jgi:hypothetical protein
MIMETLGKTLGSSLGKAVGAAVGGQLAGFGLERVVPLKMRGILSNELINNFKETNPKIFGGLKLALAGGIAVLSRHPLISFGANCALGALDVMLDKNEDKDAKIDNLSYNVSALSATAQSNDEKIKEQEKEIGGLTAKNSELAQEKQALETQLTEKEGIVKKLKTDLKNAKQENIALKNENNALNEAENAQEVVPIILGQQGDTQPTEPTELTESTELTEQKKEEPQKRGLWRKFLGFGVLAAAAAGGGGAARRGEGLPALLRIDDGTSGQNVTLGQPNPFQPNLFGQPNPFQPNLFGQTDTSALNITQASDLLISQNNLTDDEKLAVVPTNDKYDFVGGLRNNTASIISGAKTSLTRAVESGIYDPLIFVSNTLKDQTCEQYFGEENCGAAEKRINDAASMIGGAVNAARDGVTSVIHKAIDTAAGVTSAVSEIGKSTSQTISASAYASMVQGLNWAKGVKGYVDNKMTDLSNTFYPTNPLVKLPLGVTSIDGKGSVSDPTYVDFEGNGDKSTTPTPTAVSDLVWNDLLDDNNRVIHGFNLKLN